MLRGFCGSPSWTRTNDPAVNSRMLYRLSYRGISLKCFNIIANNYLYVKRFFKIIFCICTAVFCRADVCFQ